LAECGGRFGGGGRSAFAQGDEDRVVDVVVCQRSGATRDAFDHRRQVRQRVEARRWSQPAQ
jgi:hypothetical protein